MGAAFFQIPTRSYQPNALGPASVPSSGSPGNADRVRRRRLRACVSNLGGAPAACGSHGSFSGPGLLHTSRASEVGQARVQRDSADCFHQHPLRGGRSKFEQRGRGRGVISWHHRRGKPKGLVEAHDVELSDSLAKSSLFPLLFEVHFT